VHVRGVAGEQHAPDAIRDRLTGGVGETRDPDRIVNTEVRAMSLDELRCLPRDGVQLKEDLVLAWFDAHRANIAGVLEPTDGEVRETATRLRLAFRALTRISRRTPRTDGGMRAWLEAGGRLLSPDSDTARLFAEAIRAGQHSSDVSVDTDAAHVGRLLFDAYEGVLCR